MSDFTNDVGPLFTAVQLVRLRDRVKGASRLDYHGWLEPMEGPERDARRLAEGSVKGRRKQGARRRTDDLESLQWRTAFFERDFALWRGVFADEAATIAKFLGLLANLQLNVSPELEELKSLTQRNEHALRRIEGFAKELRATAAGEKTVGPDEGFPIYGELLGIADSLQRLKTRVDEKAEDAIRLVSLMTPSVDSQALMDLLTGEP